MPSPSFVSLHKTAVMSKEICLYSFPRDKAASFGPPKCTWCWKETHKELVFVPQYLLIVGRDLRLILTPKGNTSFSCERAFRTWPQTKKKCVLWAFSHLRLLCPFFCSFVKKDGTDFCSVGKHVFMGRRVRIAPSIYMSSDKWWRGVSGGPPLLCLL